MSGSPNIRYFPIDPEDRNAVEDHTLVRHVLVDFDELAVLPSETREQLVADLVDVICFVRAGVKAGKHGMSNKALSDRYFYVGCPACLGTSRPIRDTMAEVV